MVDTPPCSSLSSHYRMNYFFLGCRICRKPLEPVGEALNGIISQKIENMKCPVPAKPPQHQLEKPEYMNTDPLLTKCGHIFHKGCIKKMIYECASSKIPCPTCQKPIVLAQLRSLYFHYPDGKESLAQKIERVNNENETLAQRLGEARSRRQKCRTDAEGYKEKIKETNRRIKAKQEKLKQKEEEYESLSFGGEPADQVEISLDGLRKRNSTLSSNNAVLLKQLEYVMNNMGGDELENLEILHSLQSYFHIQKFSQHEFRRKTIFEKDCVHFENDTSSCLLMEARKSRHSDGPSSRRPLHLPTLFKELTGTRERIFSQLELVEDQMSNNDEDEEDDNKTLVPDNSQASLCACSGGNNNAPNNPPPVAPPLPPPPQPQPSQAALKYYENISKLLQAGALQGMGSEPLGNLLSPGANAFIQRIDYNSSNFKFLQHGNGQAPFLKWLSPETNPPPQETMCPWNKFITISEPRRKRPALVLEEGDAGEQYEQFIPVIRTSQLPTFSNTQLFAGKRMSPSKHLMCYLDDRRNLVQDMTIGDTVGRQRPYRCFTGGLYLEDSSDSSSDGIQVKHRRHRRTETSKKRRHHHGGKKSKHHRKKGKRIQVVSTSTLASELRRHRWRN